MSIYWLMDKQMVVHQCNKTWFKKSQTTNTCINMDKSQNQKLYIKYYIIALNDILEKTKLLEQTLELWLLRTKGQGSEFTTKRKRRFFGVIEIFYIITLIKVFIWLDMLVNTHQIKIEHKFRFYSINYNKSCQEERKDVVIPTCWWDLFSLKFEYFKERTNTSSESDNQSTAK